MPAGSGTGSLLLDYRFTSPHWFFNLLVGTCLVLAVVERHKLVARAGGRRAGGIAPTAHGRTQCSLVTNSGQLALAQLTRRTGPMPITEGLAIMLQSSGSSLRGSPIGGRDGSY